MSKEQLFKSFMMGGFECSTHRRGDGKRLDVIAATRHDEFAFADYRRLKSVGMLTARDGVRWHLIEKTPRQYDFSSVAAQIRAAKRADVQIIWDLFHYGFPDDLDLLSEEFVTRFAAFAEKFTEFLIAETDAAPLLCLANEISFFSWIAGQVGGWFPFLHGRGDEVKIQLVKASVAAAAAVKSVAPDAVLVQTDPIVNIIASLRKPHEAAHARNAHESQFHALDILLGKSNPELGGAANLIDAVGVNFYFNNQWRHNGRRLLRGSADYKPFSEMLRDYYARFRLPLFVAETGIEGAARPEWLRYVADEVKIARRYGVPILGICLYPIVNHPGWDDNRHCHNGLWDYPNAYGEREIYAPLAAEIENQIGSPAAQAETV